MNSFAFWFGVIENHRGNVIYAITVSSSIVSPGIVNLIEKILLVVDRSMENERGFKDD
jgi:hypothetical protein